MFFSPGELRRFFDYLQQRIERAAHARLYRAHCHYALYHLYACGLRVSEAVHLAVADYSAEPRTLYIRPSKFRQDRLIPVGSKAAANLEHLLNLRRKQRVGSSAIFRHFARSSLHNSAGAHNCDTETFP
jgi:integrase